MNAYTILETKALTKRYPNGKLALDNLDLSVYRGEIFGYLGPNGAGKTTTIRILLDLIRPTSGTAKLLGYDAQAGSVAVKRLVGNLPSELRLWDHMTGGQVLRYLCNLRPGSSFDYARELAERLMLDLNVHVRSYSTGNKRKVGIVQALMHRPALAILDEPTLGLDPLMSQAFYDILNEAREEGRTIFLSSHVLSEIEQICDRVAVLRAGRLQAVERIADMKRALYRWVTVITPHLLNHVDWAALPGVSEAHLIPDGVRLRVTGSMDAVVKLAARYPVQDLRVEEPSLEDFFMTFYGGSNGRHG